MDLATAASWFIPAGKMEPHSTYFGFDNGKCILNIWCTKYGYMEIREFLGQEEYLYHFKGAYVPGRSGIDSLVSAAYGPWLLSGRSCGRISMGRKLRLISGRSAGLLGFTPKCRIYRYLYALEEGSCLVEKQVVQPGKGTFLWLSKEMLRREKNGIRYQDFSSIESKHGPVRWKCNGPGQEVDLLRALLKL
jgi:hypothetical protein